jgi:hypothetical protein
MAGRKIMADLHVSNSSERVESQFYGIELMPVNVLDGLCSARSVFVRSVFELPRSTSHELAVVLFNSTPVEIVMMKRILSFVRGLQRHEFASVRNAFLIDRRLVSYPTTLYANMVRLVKRFDAKFSPSSDDVLVAMEKVVFGANLPSFNFNFIKYGESQTLSFFQLFRDVGVLNSFREYLSARPLPQVRLILLFCTSTLRFRFCLRPRELCPLCGRTWLWEHFLNCKYLEIAPGLATTLDVLKVVSMHVESGDWNIAFDFVRFYLYQWRDLVHDPALTDDDIDLLVT